MTWQGAAFIDHPSPADSGAYQTHTCGHCSAVASCFVVARDKSHKPPVQHWLQCTACGEGFVIDSTEVQHPGVRFGPSLMGLPEETDDAYNETRDCMSVNAFTAAELLCRKILMHVAVEKGATEGGTFAGYIDYLQKKQYITPTMTEWVDLIRQHGNEATHALEAPDQRRAEATAMFTAELLRVVYEMKHIAEQYTRPKEDQPPPRSIGAP